MERVSLKRRYKVSVLLFAFLLSSLPVKVNAVLPDDTVTIATTNPLTTLNPYSVKAGELNREIKTLTSMGFNYWNKDLQKVQNSQFGSYTVLTTSPLTVRFTVREGARWSDGTPISAVDLLFSHLVSSSAFAEGIGLVAGQDPTTFDSTSYGKYYESVMQALLSNDKQSLTLSYSSSSNGYPDWELFTPEPFPVHALVLLASGATGIQSLAKNIAAKNDFESAFQTRNTSVLKSYANTFNSLYSVTEVNERTNPLLLVANGPYMLDSADKLVVKLKKNLNYNSGPSLSGINSIIYRVIPSGNDLQIAVKNGEVDIAQGASTQESVNFFKSVKQNKFISYDTNAFEHVDLRVGASIFGETYSGPFAGNSSKAKALRSAFLLAFPRDAVLDKVIKPIAPHAILPNSFLLIDSDKFHDEVSTRSLFLYKYPMDDSSRQKWALNIVKSYFPEASSTKPMVDVRILYGANNSRREAIIQLAKTALAKSGFNLIPDAQTGWSSLLKSSKYDAFLFQWAKNVPGTYQIGGQISQPAYCTDCSLNYLGYSNQVVDQNHKLLNSTLLNSIERIRANAGIEQELVSDAVSIPLFRSPGNFSVSGNLLNFKPTALPEGYLWNFWEWKKGRQAITNELVGYAIRSNSLVNEANALAESGDFWNQKIQNARESRSFDTRDSFPLQISVLNRKYSLLGQKLEEFGGIESTECGIIKSDKSNTVESRAAVDACAEILDAFNAARDSYVSADASIKNTILEFFAFQEAADAKAAADLKAKQDADAKAAADLKAKQDADAKAAADLKAKLEADTKAAADLRAKLEADAKAAADLKAKQDADAKAAADLKAKLEADSKAAAAKAAAAKAAAAKAAAAKAAAAKAKKSPKVTCKKGSVVKIFDAAACPKGYVKK